MAAQAAADAYSAQSAAWAAQSTANDALYRANSAYSLAQAKSNKDHTHGFGYIGPAGEGIGMSGITGPASS